MSILLKYQPVIGVGELGAVLLQLSRGLGRLRALLDDADCDLDDIVELLRVDPAPSLATTECAALCSTLGEALRVGLGIRVTVEATKPGELPRWDHKARRVKDERTDVPF